MIRVACFIDGFNLYHAIHDLRRNELKWLNLRKLMEHFIDSKIHEIVAIYYFSAFAEWLPEEVKRHKAYVEALKYFGVTPVMGRFKEKELSCNRCDHAWTGHEEIQKIHLERSLLPEEIKDAEGNVIVKRPKEYDPPIS